MKKVKILGSGCAKCNQLADVVKDVISKEGINAVVEKVEDIQQIMAYNIMSTPALVVDEKVLCFGPWGSAGQTVSAMRSSFLSMRCRKCCCC